MKLSDTNLLNWIIENGASIDAPEEGESSTWVIYTKTYPFSAGAGCHSDLRTAINLAMIKKPL